HQSRLVERRIGVGRTGKACYAAGNGRLHLRFQSRLVLEPGFAQSHGDVDQSWANDQAAGIEHSIGAPTVGCVTLRKHLSRSNEQRRLAVDFVLRVDDYAVEDIDLHRTASMDVFRFSSWLPYCV